MCLAKRKRDSAQPQYLWLIPSYAMCAPIVSTYTEYNDSLAAINNRFRFAPPKEMLAQVSGKRIIPMRSPFGAIT